MKLLKKIFKRSPPKVDPVVRAQKLQAWFAKECEELRPQWEDRLNQLRASQKRQVTPAVDPRFGKVLLLEKLSGTSTETYTKQLADGAEKDVQDLRAELTSMMTRTSILVSAASLLFAAFYLSHNPANAAPVWVITFVITSLAFAVAIKPLGPPFWRAWIKSYRPRQDWNLLVFDDFTRWVMACWYGNRLTPAITTYKKAHAVASPLLVFAAVAGAVVLATL